MHLKYNGKTVTSRVAQPLIAALILGLSALQADAQSAAQLAPDGFAPQLRQLQGSIEFSGAPGLSAPPGADQLLVNLNDVNVTGALDGMQAATDRVFSPLIGQNVRVTDIFSAAQDLETAYAAAGFVLTRVVLPAQDLRNGGTLQISVVNGFVEAIDAADVPPEIRERLLALTEPLVEQDSIRLGELERRLLIAGDTYGVALGSALSTGERPGGTVIVLDPQYRRVTGFASVNNRLSDPLGSVRLETGFEVNSAFKQGEVIYGRLSGSPDLVSADPKMRTLALGSVVPIGIDGLLASVEGTASQTQPDTTGLATKSKFSRLSLGLNYPWQRSRTVNFSSQVNLDFQSDALDQVSGGAIHKDDLRILRLASDIAWSPDEQSSARASAVFSKGFDAFGARNAADAAASGTPLSRGGTDADFSKFEVSAQYRRQVGAGFNLLVSGRGQLSFGDPLPSSEQLVVANEGELSAFKDGALSGDAGFVLRTQISAPQAAEFGTQTVQWVPFVYGAHAELSLEQPTAQEQSKTSASAMGVGIEFIGPQNSDFSNLSLTLEFGRGFRNDSEPDPRHVFLSSSYRF